MGIGIGKKIKQLRIDGSITQEALADYLGVTAQAVSRWERGSCYPDIGLLPQLAEFFGVTTDELLCVDKTEANRQISAYVTQAEKLRELGKYAELISLMRRALAEHPSNADLKLLLADALSAACTETTLTPELREACDLCTRITADPRTSEDQKGKARRILCTVYTFHLHDEEKTESVIRAMTNWNYSRELFTAHYRTGEDAYMQLRQNLKWLADNIWSIMMRYASPEESYVSEQFSREEKLLIVRKSLALLELIFDGDYKYYNTHVCTSYVTLAKLLMPDGDAASAVEALAKAAKYAADYDARPEAEPYRCVLVKDILYRKHEYSEHKAHTECYYLREQMDAPIFRTLRDREDFKALYEALCKKE